MKQLGPDKKPLQSRVYIATKVTSEFKGGSFEQTLDGSLYLFPIPSGKNAANPAAAASTAALVASPDSQRTQSNTVKKGPGWVGAGGKLTGGGAAVGNPTLSGSTDPNNKNIRPGSLRDRAAQQRLTAVPYQQTVYVGAPNSNAYTDPNGVVVGGDNLDYTPPPKPPTDGTGAQVAPTNTQVVEGPPKLPNASQPGLVDRFLNKVAGQKINVGERGPNTPTAQIRPTEP